VCTSTDIYNPLAAKTPFRHHFFTSDTEEQQELADRVIAHLAQLVVCARLVVEGGGQRAAAQCSDVGSESSCSVH